ncbi:peroxiredoxin-like family protein [Arcticibacterium luteifluviistationis]|uniref:thioredoxin-dependent peroxiredoxin n=1 Tax=Arcticibacterium luteifluviistationis TaxID=1784714 RepID=A0A2Z4GB65_9BACT|nr:peroxiredoxin-like family protein [Arcticibacterium luteifluviistationis]AWV98466.1 antioxidant AhpC [Arcticibacterium luteifluviistationis]
MKNLLLLCFFFTSLNILAQTAEQPTDISPLLIGEKIPAATVIDPSGKKYDLLDVLNEKPTILVFYRGGWCPYCNKQLAGLVSIEKDIIALGYQIVAISPDKYEDLVNTEEKNKIAYRLFSDPGATLLKNVGIAFGNPDDKHGILPVPTLMIVNKKAEIIFEHINPNFRKRIEPSYLMEVIKAIKDN